jgi:hypothetical protein
VAACDAPEEERCPVCEEADTAKEQQANQKFEKIAASGTLNIPWDGKAIAMEKTKGKVDGKTRKCQCYKREDPPPGEWTVKLCGLRLTSQTGTNSQQQCVTGKVTLPPEGQVQVELNFPQPPAPPAKGKKGKKAKP